MDEKADARASRIAEDQAGCIARRQALRVGITNRMIGNRVTKGQWRRLDRGVYVVNGVPWSWEQDVWAAMLRAGLRAVATHQTALLLRGLPSDRLPRYPVTLTVPHGQHRRIAGAIVHQVDDLRPHHYSLVGLMPVSLPARALVEIAALMGQRRLGSLLDELIAQKWTTIAAVAACLSEVARHGKPGVGTLASVLDERGPGFVPPASQLEALLFAALRSGRLPAAVRQIRLPGRGAVEGVADAAYPEALMLLEADGRRWHTRIGDLRRDHARDAEAARVGWVTLRFVYEQLARHPQEVAATVKEVRRTRLRQLALRAS
jgi:very-short-patch-repair endonuclease